MKRGTLLDQLLEEDGLRFLFQPIFRIQNGDTAVAELEGLARGPRGTHVELPDVLFEYVRRKGKAALVDRACVRGVLRAAATLESEHRLGINVNASTLGGDAGFADFLGAECLVRGIRPDRVTVEIVEHTPYWDSATFLRTLAALRDMGVRIAIDDIGSGQSNYGMILDCKPDSIKVDRYIVRGCGGEPHRRSVLASIVQLADGLGAGVVAEGIEDAADLEAVSALGIRFVQGYLLGHPMDIADLRMSVSAQTAPSIPSTSLAG